MRLSILFSAAALLLASFASTSAFAQSDGRAPLALPSPSLQVSEAASGGQSSSLQAASAWLPDAPGAVVPATPSAVPADEVQTKRILNIMPNFRAVSAGQTLPPQTSREKLVVASQDDFDYSALIFSGIIASSSMAGKATPEFHQGMAGYGRYYWHTLADQSIENYFVEFIVPSIAHEDSRYYSMGREGGGFVKRAGYALSRSVVTRTDSGKKTFNFAEVVGAGAAAGVSSLYYPGKERTAANELRNWGLDVGYDSVAFLLHEFWPDISHGLLHRRAATQTAAMGGEAK